MEDIIDELKEINRPKQVIRAGYNYTDSLYCPECRELVGTNEDGLYNGNYCSNCGAKLKV